MYQIRGTVLGKKSVKLGIIFGLRSFGTYVFPVQKFCDNFRNFVPVKLLVESLHKIRAFLDTPTKRIFYHFAAEWHSIAEKFDSDAQKYPFESTK